MHRQTSAPNYQILVRWKPRVRYRFEEPRIYFSTVHDALTDCQSREKISHAKQLARFEFAAFLPPEFPQECSRSIKSTTKLGLHLPYLGKISSTLRFLCTDSLPQKKRRKEKHYSVAITNASTRIYTLNVLPITRCVKMYIKCIKT